MSAVQERARILIDSLSDEDVEVLIKMAERLAEWGATQELLEDEEMVASIKRGLKDLERGDTLSLEELRKSVSG
ncbi:hypothetical protein KAX17_17175 [Candidatus Bipolaricaulota bacterium]|nr:hypothetical protein [Candidatus Bipolaricaulota bacterium]MCK4600219.1 hypothetical protein [Candidatus Bipolaricaulota bacterium]